MVAPRPFPIRLVCQSHQSFTVDLANWVVILVRAAIGFTPVLILELIWLSAPWFSAAVPVVIGAPLALITLLRRWEILSYAWWSPARRKQGATVGGERLVCIGDPIELDQLADIDAEVRDPSVFRALRISFGGLQWGLLATGLGLWGVTRVLVGPDQFPRVLVLVVALSICMMVVHLSRDYYRVVPQGLDKLSFGVLGCKGGSCESWDLKNARVTCNFAKRSLEITPVAGGADGGTQAPQKGPSLRSLRLSLRRFDKPHAFAIAVFRAALSERPSPPLPEDELVG